MARIVSIGSSLQDIYLVDHDDFCEKDETYARLVVGSKVDIDKLVYTIGGGGVNSAVTFARHGHEVVLLSNVARDAAGALVVRELTRAGVDTSHITFLEHKNTGTSVVLLDTASGERTILTYRGASEQFGNFSAAEVVNLAPDWLYLTTLRGDFTSLRRFLQAARTIGAKVMFNPGSKELEQPDKLTKLLEYVDILNLNLDEARKLSTNGEESPRELIKELGELVQTVIITDGPRGTIATNGAETYEFGLYEDCPVADATGAGDAFGSGFLAAHAAGKSFAEALTFAAANATAVVQKIGGHTCALTGLEKLHPIEMRKI